MTFILFTLQLMHLCIYYGLIFAHANKSRLLSTEVCSIMSVLILCSSGCDCNGYNSECNVSTGVCECLSFGVTGDHCRQCDAISSGSASNFCFCKLFVYVIMCQTASMFTIFLQLKWKLTSYIHTLWKWIENKKDSSLWHHQRWTFTNCMFTYHYYPAHMRKG